MSALSTERPRAGAALAAWAARGAAAGSALASGAGLSVLIFHRVLPEPDPLFPGEVDAARFERLMRLVRLAYRVMPLDEAVRRLAEGCLPARALAISFDDGYADNHDVAAPILNRLALPATVFVATGSLDGGRMWNDSVIESLRRCSGDHVDLGFLKLPTLPLRSLAQRHAAIASVLPLIKYRNTDERKALLDELHLACGRPALPNNLMMTRDQVGRMARAGFGIGAHTVSHPILQALPLAQAEREIVDGRDELCDLVGRPITLFAYPNGRPGQDYDDRHVALVRRLGFDAAVSTAPGTNRAGADPYQLRRFSPWDRSDARWMMRLGWKHVRS